MNRRPPLFVASSYIWFPPNRIQYPFIETFSFWEILFTEVWKIPKSQECAIIFFCKNIQIHTDKQDQRNWSLLSCSVKGHCSDWGKAVGTFSIFSNYTACTCKSCSQGWSLNTGSKSKPLHRCTGLDSFTNSRLFPAILQILMTHLWWLPTNPFLKCRVIFALVPSNKC